MYMHDEENQSVGKGHTKWLGGPPVAHPRLILF